MSVSVNLLRYVKKVKKSRVAQISRFTHAHRPAKYPHVTRRTARGQGTEARTPQAIIPAKTNRLVRCGRGTRSTRRSGMDKLVVIMAKEYVHSKAGNRTSMYMRCVHVLNILKLRTISQLYGRLGIIKCKVNLLFRNFWYIGFSSRCSEAELK